MGSWNDCKKEEEVAAAAEKSKKGKRLSEESQ